jgi:predicted alpha/beta hydrolase
MDRMWTPMLYRWWLARRQPKTRTAPGRMPVAPNETFTVLADDGYRLNGSLWQGAGNGPVVVIHAATAVRAGYYARFAAWLSGRGCTVLTFDYRGIGQSRHGPLRGMQAGWVHWGALDAGAVQAYARSRWSGRPLMAVGHSIGGFTLGLAPASAHLSRIVTVGAQFAYWRDYAPGQRLPMYLKWHLTMPILTRIFGYFPGARLGWLEDVPGGVALDWAGMGPRFEVSVTSQLAPAELATRHGSTRARLLGIGLTDDPFGTEAATARLLGYYTNADRTHLRLAPGEIGAPKIGHFAFFHSRFEQTLWPLVAAWLLEGRLPAAAPGRIVAMPPAGQASGATVP